MTQMHVLLKRSVEIVLKPFLVIAGLATIIPGLAAFFPENITTGLLKLEYIESYRLVIQHWGMMVSLMGVFIMLSAFYTQFRTAILWYSTIEKTFMVLLYFRFREHSFTEGFTGVMIADSIIVACTLVYFYATCRVDNGNTSPKK